jgi:hypothetical protein
MRDEIHEGYTKEELSWAFDAVADPDDWKGAIDSVIPRAEFEKTYAAIEFYTATKATCSVYNEIHQLVRIRAAGYRAGPAGDH